MFKFLKRFFQPGFGSELWKLKISADAELFKIDPKIADDDNELKQARIRLWEAQASEYMRYVGNVEVEIGEHNAMEKYNAKKADAVCVDLPRLPEKTEANKNT